MATVALFYLIDISHLIKVYSLPGLKPQTKGGGHGRWGFYSGKAQGSWPVQ